MGLHLSKLWMGKQLILSLQYYHSLESAGLLLCNIRPIAENHDKLKFLIFVHHTFKTKDISFDEYDFYQEYKKELADALKDVSSIQKVLLWISQIYHPDVRDEMLLLHLLTENNMDKGNLLEYFYQLHGTELAKNLLVNASHSIECLKILEKTGLNDFCLKNNITKGAVHLFTSSYCLDVDDDFFEAVCQAVMYDIQDTEHTISFFGEIKDIFSKMPYGNKHILMSHFLSKLEFTPASDLNKFQLNKILGILRTLTNKFDPLWVKESISRFILSAAVKEIFFQFEKIDDMIEILSHFINPDNTFHFVFKNKRMFEYHLDGILNGNHDSENHIKWNIFVGTHWEFSKFEVDYHRLPVESIQAPVPVIPKAPGMACVYFAYSKMKREERQPKKECSLTLGLK